MSEAAKISVNGDEFLKKHNEWSKGEASDASNSGTRREAMGAYAEKCGIENKAMSQVRAGLKIKNPGKREDWFRSLQALMPIAEREVFSNGPGLPLEEPEDQKMKEAREAKVKEAADAAAEEANDIAADHGAGDPDLAQDAEDFDKAADEALGDEPEKKVTPLNFGAKGRKTKAKK